MDALPFTAELLREPLIVLHDSLALSGSFLHPVLLKLTLQAGHPVVLLAVAQAQAHYQQVLRKLGVNMAACMQSGQLTVIDTLSADGALDDADLAAGGPQLFERLSGAVAAAQQLADSRLDNVFSAAAAKAGEAIAAGCRRRPVNLFIDDVSTLCGLFGGHTDSGWRGFLQRVVTMVHASQGDATPTSLVALTHRDVCDLAAEEVLVMPANVLISVEPLTAGQSVDVSGRLAVRLQHCRAEVTWGQHEGDAQQRFFFKVSDRGVRFLQQYTAS